MTNAEFNEMAALVVRLRKDLELHTDALKQSNAHCGKLLVQNEQLQLQLTSVTKELEYARKAINALDQIDKNITDASALYGRRAGETVSAFIERIASVRDQFYRELVDVRAALAATTEQRDSLQRTLDEWSNADTEPHDRVTAEDVADHVVPPVCFDCGSRLVEVGGLVFLCRSADCMKRLPTGAP